MGCRKRELLCFLEVKGSLVRQNSEKWDVGKVKPIPDIPNEIFRAKFENVTSVRRTDGCEFTGSARYRGEPKIRKIRSAVWKL